MHSHPSVVRVTDRLAELGATGSVKVLDGSARTAAQAAEQLGIEVAQIANSLVFSADATPLLVLASGGHRVDTTKVAALVGAASVDRADADFVRTHTGFAIGGVAPIGHLTPIDAWLDPKLLTYDVIWAAAGTPNHVFAVAPQALVAATGATVADFTAA